MTTLKAHTFSERPSVSGAMLGTPLFVLLAFVLPVMLVLLIPAPSETAWGPLLITAVAGGRYAWLIGAGRRRLNELTTWLFVLVFLGVSPTVQIRMSIAPSTTPGVRSSWNDATSAAVLVGIAAFAIGLALAQGKRSAAGTEVPEVVEPVAVSQTRARWLAVGGLCAWAYYVSSIGIGALLTSREDINKAVTSVASDSALRALLPAVATMTLLVAFAALLQVRRDQRRVGCKNAPVLLLVVAVALLLAVNPISSARYVFGTVALGMLAALGAYATPGRFRFVAVAALAGLVGIFPSVGTLRYSASTGSLGKSLSITEGLTSGDFDSFAQINNTLVYVARNGITWGEQALGVLTFWVPRSLWPGKPVDTGILVGTDQGYDFTNLSAPLWAEFYVNAGWLGLVAGFVAFGYGVRRWDNRIAATLQRWKAPSPMACIVPFYLILMLRGSLLQAMAYFSVIAVSAWWVRDRSRSALSTSDSAV